MPMFNVIFYINKSINKRKNTFREDMPCSKVCRRMIIEMKTFYGSMNSVSLCILLPEAAFHFHLLSHCILHVSLCASLSTAEYPSIHKSFLHAFHWMNFVEGKFQLK